MGADHPISPGWRHMAGRPAARIVRGRSHQNQTSLGGQNRTNDSNLLELKQASHGGEEPNRFPRPPVVRRVDEDHEASQMEFETVTPNMSAYPARPTYPDRVGGHDRQTPHQRDGGSAAPIIINPPSTNTVKSLKSRGAWTHSQPRWRR